MRITILSIFLTFSFVLSAQKTPFKSHFKMGKALADSGDYSNAKVELLKAYSINKKSDSLLNELAYCYYQTNSYRTAIDYANKLIKLKTAVSADGYVVKCASYEGLKKRDFALHHYQKGVDLYPQKHELNLNYALALFSAKEYSKAEYYAAQAVLTNKRNDQAHYLLYKIAVVQDNRPKALLSALYYALLLQDEEQCNEAYRLVLKLWWQEPSLEGNKLMRNVHSNIDFDGFGSIETLVNEANSVFVVNMTPTEELAKMTEANKKLFDCILENYKLYPDNFWWEFYGQFLGEMGGKNFAESCTFYLARNSYKAEVLSLVSGEVGDFSKFSYWLELQFIK